ncbi:MAG: dephospho-CoA kinase, partial [Planctomycetota bacterium]
MIVGIAGDICSGKTTVSKELEKQGAKVFYADDMVTKLYQNKYIKKKLLAIFGKKIFETYQKKDINKWTINRKKIAKIIFSDNKAKKKLESLIHPLVRRKMNAFIEKHRDKIIVLDVPLLFENGLAPLCDRIVFVKSSPKQILKRLKERNISTADYKRRKQSQLSLKIKLKLSNYIISNTTNTLQDLKFQCKKLYKELEEE